MSKQEYSRLTARRASRSPLLRDCVCAFAVGGSLCALGEAVILLAQAGGVAAKEARLLASLTLIALSALLTGLHIYDSLAKHAGAGTLVPITGFANAMASPAMEFKSEGFVLGVGAKLFSIAGPVIVYGVAASVLYGLVLWIVGLV